MKRFAGRQASQLWTAATAAASSRLSTRKLPIHLPRRCYHFTSPAADPATLRLYRILLRQCQELTSSSSSATTTTSSSSSSNGSSSSSPEEPILLQPPLDPLLAGLSRVFASSLSRQVTPSHVLRLFGHWREQELERRRRGKNGNHNDYNNNNSSKSAASTTANNAATDNKNKNTNDAAYEDDEQEKLLGWLGPLIAKHGAGGDDPWMDSYTLWATPTAIRQAIRLAFRHQYAAASSSDDDDDDSTFNHRIGPSDTRFWAIRAYQYLSAQTEMQRLVRHRRQQHRQDDDTEGVRITTLARCVGRSASTQRPSSLANDQMQYKYRFVYRIRIENTSKDRVFQLLGRSWIIQEHAAAAAVAVDMRSDKDGNEKDSAESVRGSSIKVHAPQTGAVGKHPVLETGQVFEYMSGCDLATPTGLMKGCFHFAWVPAGTPSASVGQAVPALEASVADQKFEVPVTPFPLAPDRLPVFE